MDILTLEIKIQESNIGALKRSIKLQFFSIMICTLVLVYDFTCVNVSNFHLISSGALLGVTIFSVFEFMINFIDYKLDKVRLINYKKINDNENLKGAIKQYENTKFFYEKAKEEYEKYTNDVKEMMNNYKCQICSNKEINNSNE